MERFDHIIIGGGIAGTSAAEAIRSKDATASVLIISEEPHLVYSRVLLPHVIRGKTPEEKIFLRNAESYESKKLTLKSGIHVTSLDRAARTLSLSDGSSVEYSRALLIATGGSVKKMDCPGAVDADVMYFQTLEDARRISASAARQVLVYGGGFIGIELLMSFVHLGARVTAVVRGPGYFNGILDARGMEMVSDEVRRHGVTLLAETEVVAIENTLGMRKVILSRGEPVSCDAVAAGIGIIPNVNFLAGSDIEIRKGVVTDAALRSSVPDVFAAGDVAESPDPFTLENRLAGNWQNAMFQGKLAGNNMAGGEEEFRTLTAYNITCFGLPVSFIGSIDRRASERVVRETMQGSLQLFMNGSRVVGATCVGPFAERAAVTKLINDRVEFSDSMRRAVSAGSTPLADLIP